ncbi:hypothetical protein Q6348_05705, partial [Isoptericola sp. b441]
MRLRTKIGAGAAGGAIILAAALGTASAASAATDDTTTTPSWCTGAGHGAGMRGWGATDGVAARYGVTALADYLAEKLGVAADDVTAALQAFHAENPVTVRGRDLSDADLAERRAAEATSLADALGVKASDVSAALESFSSDRQA